MTGPLAVLYGDKHCLVVAKPARLLTASDKSGDETLLALARAFHYGRQAPGKKGYLVPLHFLDRPVSGAVMFALSSKAAARLAAQFRSGQIEKTYYAVVEGQPSQKTGTLHCALLKNRETNVTTVVPSGTQGAKISTLSYQVLEQRGALSLLEIKPKTGRSHQIRVQLADAGWPIYGDRKYGAASTWDNCIALHARQVNFTHPVDKTAVIVTAPLPANWRQLWPRDWD